ESALTAGAGGSGGPRITPDCHGRAAPRPWTGCGRADAACRNLSKDIARRQQAGAAARPQIAAVEEHDPDARQPGRTDRRRSELSIAERETIPLWLDPDHRHAGR